MYLGESAELEEESSQDLFDISHDGVGLHDKMAQVADPEMHVIEKMASDLKSQQTAGLFWGEEFANIALNLELTADPYSGMSLETNALRRFFINKWLCDFPKYLEVVFAGLDPALQEDADLVDDLVLDFIEVVSQRVHINGKLFHRYVLDFIGGGTYKNVHKAVYIPLQEGSAVLRADAVQDDKLPLDKRSLALYTDEIVPMLAHESAILAHVQNLVDTTTYIQKNMVKYHGPVVLEGQVIALSFDLLKGFRSHLDLGSLLKEAAISPTLQRQVASFVRDALEGLIFLHDNNVAHIDFKPENIFLHKDAHGYQGKLGDFGGAKHLDKLELRYHGFRMTEHYVHKNIIERVHKGIMDPRFIDLGNVSTVLSDLKNKGFLETSLAEKLQNLPWTKILESEFYDNSLLHESVRLIKESLK